MPIIKKAAQIHCAPTPYICSMLTYRVQFTGCKGIGDGIQFILRHPDREYPLFICKTQQEVIDKLPAYFKARKNEHCAVEIISDEGKYERTIYFPLEE